MDSSEPVMFVLGVVGAIGVFELLIWIVVIIRDPGFDGLRHDHIPNTTPTAPEGPEKSRTVMS